MKNKKSKNPRGITVVLKRNNMCENTLESVVKTIVTITVLLYTVEEARSWDGFSLTLP